MRIFAEAAAAPAPLTGVQEADKHQQRGWRLPHVLADWQRWWALPGAEQKASDAKPQPLRSIVSKLWRLMRVNKVLLAGAFVCMVSWHRCGLQSLVQAKLRSLCLYAIRGSCLDTLPAYEMQAQACIS